VQRARGGTPSLCVPEQCRHLSLDDDIVELDGRSDIYSFGIIAYELLAGRLPWDCRSMEEAFRAHLEMPVPSFASVGARVPRRLERFVQRCLAKDRDQRFPDVRAARAELERIANPKQPWFAYVSAIAIVAAVVLWFLRPDPPMLARLEVADDRVFLGPARPTLTCAVTNLLPALRGSKVRWVKEAIDPQPVLGTWQLRLDGQNLTIEAPPDAAIEGQSACLQFSDDRSTQFSQRVSIAYLLKNSCKIVEKKVRNAAGRVIDPNGAVLEVVVETPDPAWIHSVEVECGGDTLPTEVKTRTPVAVVYELSLQDFSALAKEVPQDATLRVRVKDKADYETSDDFQVSIDPRRLTFRPALVNCPLDPEAIVYAAPLLRLNANRPVQPDEVTIEGLKDTKPFAVTFRPEGNDLRLTNLEEQDSYRGSLTIRVNEQAAVYHSNPERGRDEKLLPFRFEKDRPTVRIITQDRALRELGEGSTYVTNQDFLRLRLLRDNDVPTTVVLECNRGGTLLATKEVALHPNQESTERIELAEDGEYSVVAKSFRHYGATRDPSQQPEAKIHLTIERDKKPLTVRLVEPPAKIGGPVAAEAVWFKLSIDEQRSAAATLRWQLDGSAKRAGETEILPGAAAEESITWSRLELQPEELEDGSYELRLTAVDAAGNPADLAPVKFVVARKGPELRLKMPTPDWSDKDGDVFTLRIAPGSERSGQGRGTRQVEGRGTGNDGLVSFEARSRQRRRLGHPTHAQELVVGPGGLDPLARCGSRRSGDGRGISRETSGFVRGAHAATHLAPGRAECRSSSRHEVRARQRPCRLPVRGSRRGAGERGPRRTHPVCHTTKGRRGLLPRRARGDHRAVPRVRALSSRLRRSEELVRCDAGSAATRAAAAGSRRTGCTAARHRSAMGRVRCIRTVGWQATALRGRVGVRGARWHRLPLVLVRGARVRPCTVRDQLRTSLARGPWL
jgi:hypothetical protein